MKLVVEFPELDNEQARNAMLVHATDSAYALDRPDLADDPEFWRQVCIKRRALFMAGILAEVDS
jgi:hypothetical protein